MGQLRIPGPTPCPDEALQAMTFVSCDDQPNDWQSSLFVNQTDHQDDAIMSSFTTIDRKYQFTDLCQACQYLLCKWHVICFVSRMLILDPAFVAFHTTFRLRSIRCIPGYCWQLTVFALNDPGYQSCQCVQISSKIPFRLIWKQFFQCYSNGTIYSTVVTHWFTSVLSWWKKRSVTYVSTVIF